MKQIIVEKNRNYNNNDLADRNRSILKEKQIFTINLLGSQGSGKTYLLEKLIENIKNNIILKNKFKIKNFKSNGFIFTRYFSYIFF